ncbi:MAG: GNAT family N-acetyltransferase [archaeon]
MRIEKAKLKDIPKIEEIYLETVIDELRTQFPKMRKKELLRKPLLYTEKRLESYKESIKSKKGVLLIIKEKKEIVGFGQAKVVTYDKTKAIIKKGYLLKEFRRRGWGEKLIKKIMILLKRNGIKEVDGRVFIKNKPSIKMQEKLGFKPLVLIMNKKLK